MIQCFYDQCIQNHYLKIVLCFIFKLCYHLFWNSISLLTFELKMLGNLDYLNKFNFANIFLFIECSLLHWLTNHCSTYDMHWCNCLWFYANFNILVVHFTGFPGELTRNHQFFCKWPTTYPNMVFLINGEMTILNEINFHREIMPRIRNKLAAPGLQIY